MEKADTGNRENTQRVYTVGLEGMEFVAFHGCREDEILNGNVFVVDFKADYSCIGGDTDKLEDTVNYGDIFRTIEKVMRGERRNLLESLAAEIIDAVTEKFPELLKATVRVRKKNPPVAGPCEWSSITLEWNA